MIIPFYGLDRQYANLKDELLDATDKALIGGKLMNGEFTYKLESWLEERTGCRYAVTVHSGTQALELLAKAEITKNNLYIDPTFKPIVCIPDITYIATMNAFINAGYTVKLVDVDKNGLLKIDPDDENWLYCTVGLHGAPSPRPDKHSLLIDTFVDGAQSWLIERDINLGMAISFDPTKNLNASGNGGAIVTNDYDLYMKVCELKHNGIDPLARNPPVSPGTNSKMSELDCAHVMVRTRYLDQWQARRKKIRLHYLDQFKDLPIRCFSRDFEKHADQKFAIYVGKRDDLREHLRRSKIETKIHYPEPLSSLPISHNLVKPTALSSSNMIAAGTLSLPIYPELTDAEVEYISDSVKKFFT